MNTDTGEIETFDEKEELDKAIKEGNWEQINGIPKKSCRRCHGRGFTGRDINTGTLEICRCVKLELKGDRGAEVEKVEVLHRSIHSNHTSVLLSGQINELITNRPEGQVYNYR